MTAKTAWTVALPEAESGDWGHCPASEATRRRILCTRPPRSSCTTPVANFSAPVGNFSAPVGNFPGPVGNFPGPVGNFPGPVGNFPGPVGNFPGPVGNFPGPVGTLHGHAVIRTAPSVKVCHEPHMTVESEVDHHVPVDSGSPSAS
jgi:hypothetical protein